MGAGIARSTILSSGLELSGGYRILERIGGGGMGVVYRAEHVALERMFAIKVLRKEYCTEKAHRDRFLQEARAASKIRHMNVVDISNFGKLPDGAPFFVMEYLIGEDLHEQLSREGRFAYTQVCEMLQHVTSALAAAHALGVIHRDIKPANCVVTVDSHGRELIKVIDFGIAKVKEMGTATTGQLTQTGVPLGTVKYMSPEQLRCEAVDARTDIYALGIMTYELLTGRVPFDSQQFTHVIAQHLNDDAKPPSEAAPHSGIPRAIDIIVLKALAKRPEDRFQSMLEFGQALRTALGGPSETVEHLRVPATPPPKRAADPSEAPWTTGLLHTQGRGRKAKMVALRLSAGLASALVVGGIGYIGWRILQPDDAVAPAVGTATRTLQGAIPTISQPAEDPPQLDDGDRAVASRATTPVGDRMPADGEEHVGEAMQTSGSDKSGERELEPTKEKAAAPEDTDEPDVPAISSDRPGKTQKPTRPRPATEAKPQGPRSLTSDEIRDTRAALAPGIESCRRTHGTRFPRKFRVKLRVAANGGVLGPHAIGERDTDPLVRCVVKVIRGARFPRDVVPQFVTWPFEL